MATINVLCETKAKNMKNLSKQTAAELAIQMATLDAIEKGHTNPAELAEYIKSKTAEAAVNNYMKLILEQF